MCYAMGFCQIIHFKYSRVYITFPNSVTVPPPGNHEFVAKSVSLCFVSSFVSFLFFYLYFFIVLVLPFINMNLPQVYMCSPSWTPFPPPFLYDPSGSFQCTNPKHPVSCIETGLGIHFISFHIPHIRDFFFSIWFHSVWRSLGPSMLLQMALSHFLMAQ